MTPVQRVETALVALHVMAMGLSDNFLLAEIEELKNAWEDVLKRGITLDGTGFDFMPGDQVLKPMGYDFVGEVRSSFLSISGARRHVVEHRQSIGLMHIFAPEQLSRVHVIGQED